MSQLKIIDKLTEDIFHNEYFKILFDKCSLINAEQTINKEIKSILSNKELKDSLRFADILSNSLDSSARNRSYQIVTFLNYSYCDNEIYRTMSKAIYSKLGNFPAVRYLENLNSNHSLIPLDRMIEVEAKKIIQHVPDSENQVFTDSQYFLFKNLSSSLRYSFSGPTSMGKSFIIKAFIRKVIKNIPPENLVVLVPTRALINQFTIDLKGELQSILERYNYKIATNSNISDLLTEEVHNYILILTPERLISYLSQKNNPPIGFLFVDEAHKLAQEKDSRSITTYSAIERTLSKYGKNVKLHFSSPNVSNPEVFLNLFGSQTSDNYFQTDESPVSQNLYFIDIVNETVELIEKNDFKKIETENFNEKFSTISRVIDYLGENSNNLIYNNSKPKTINGAVDFVKNRDHKKIEITTAIANASKQIRDYIHKDYFLADLIENGVAYHHGKLPQLLRNLVEDLYKSEEIRNVFCTSTLLEGVNMPTKNLFILNNKNGLGKLEEIDFWNLTGRAGRLNKELFGNIYCIKHEDCTWENKRTVLLKKPITLKPTILTKIDKNLQKIEKILLNKNISGTETEKEILDYIANIICIDTLEIRSSYKSPVIEKLIEKNKQKIIDLAKSITKDITVPREILNANQSINISKQQKIFNILKGRHLKKQDIRLPNTDISYAVCLRILESMYDLYEWEKAEKKLSNKNSMKYYAVIMNQWMNGITLNQIIVQSLNWHDEKSLQIQVDYNEFAVFEKNNLNHINIVIEKIIDDIEYVLRFLFEKYFNHYYQIIINLLGEENSGENWATLLEYGTQNRIVIALQNMGLSRHTAMTIYNKCRYALNIQDSKLVSISKSEILKNYKESSIEYHEINNML